MNDRFTTADDAVRQVVHAFLAAVASRDLRRVRALLAPAVTWQNVPHTPTTGRDAVVELLGDVITRSDHVEWEIVSERYDQGIGQIERIDRFVIDGVELSVACDGEFTVDTFNGVVAGVRDEVDLPSWRALLAPAMAACAGRTPVDVVERHLAAVSRRDVVAMAADYAPSAELRRGDDVHRGWIEIAEYFESVPGRLGARTLDFDAPAELDAQHVVVGWTITDGARVAASGTDTYTVVAGRITGQRVALHTADF